MGSLIQLFSSNSIYCYWPSFVFAFFFSFALVYLHRLNLSIIPVQWASLLHNTFSFKFVRVESLWDRLNLLKSSLAASASSPNAPQVCVAFSDAPFRVMQCRNWLLLCTLFYKHIFLLENCNFTSEKWKKERKLNHSEL